MKLTLLYQSKGLAEREWIPDIFRAVAGEVVHDEKHEVVLDNCLLIDFFLHRRSDDYYAKFRGKNAWLFHIADEAYDGGYDKYKYFHGVFRNHWSGIFNSRRVVQLPLGYTAGLPLQQNLPEASSRKYLWSFLGQARKSSRPEMAKAFQHLDNGFSLITDQKDVKSLGKDGYYQVLRDSAFVPCPMGNVHLESFRVYESIECGAIPIIEKRWSLDYYRSLLGDHPLPTFTSWDRAAEFASAMHHDPAALNSLQTKCVQWWSEKKQSLRDRVAAFVASAPGDEAGPYYTWKHSLPGWQYTELLRHHSAPAIARRFKSQIQLLALKGKMRR
ncbi:MAG TPA: hypothetical protein VG844_18925 [Terracidiphilus sp.]|nr:hypothetical protein [Terracidiphilus sp.]